MARIVWTDDAINDVRSIFEFIAHDAPFRAAIFIDELIDYTDRLEDLPFSGRIIPERSDPAYRELIFHNYRIMYRTKDSLVEILHVHHGARLFDSTMLN
jgi:plasmid stabilization system protein ParE